MKHIRFSQIGSSRRGPEHAGDTRRCCTRGRNLRAYRSFQVSGDTECKAWMEPHPMTMTQDQTTPGKRLDSIRIWISAASTGDAARVRSKLDRAGLVASLTRAEMTRELDDQDCETAAIW